MKWCAVSTTRLSSSAASDVYMVQVIEMPSVGRQTGVEVNFAPLEQMAALLQDDPFSGNRLFS